MKTITLNITNNSQETFIQPFSEQFTAETMPKAVGLALMGAWQRLTSQYDSPCVSINGVPLSTSQIRLMHKKDFLTFQINFGLLRESILPSLAIINREDRVDYFRHTDKTGVFESQSSFSSQEVAIQGKEVMKKTRFVTSLIKEDAKASVWTPKQLAAYQSKQEAAQKKRIAAKLQK